MSKNKKQMNHHFQYAILVNNNQEKVWGFLTDVERWKDWDTELKDSSLSEKFSLGAKGELTPKKGPKLKFYISQIAPFTSYTFVTKMPVGTLEIKRTLDKTGNSIIFTDDIKFTGFLKYFFGFMIGGRFKAVLPEVMENFKRMAEQA